MPSSRLRRLWQACARFALQACFWVALSLAIAAMMVVGGPFEFTDALRFSATNWMPWALITPAVFWASRRFPVVRGRLVRSIPVHLVACVACSMAASWLAMQFPMGFTGLRAGRKISADELRGSVTGVGFGPAGLAVAGGAALVPGAAGPFTKSGSVLSFQSAAGAVTFHSVDPPGPGAKFDPVPIRRSPEPQIFTHSVPPMMPANGAGVVSVNVGPPPTFSRPRFTWQMLVMPLAMRANAGFAIYFILASAAHAMAFYRQAQEKQRQALALAASRNQAKLDALRLQLQPHFLFNTLNAISTLVHRDANAADNLIGDLSDLLRASLQTNSHEVALTRELELLDHYLAIEQARLGDRLRIVREIDPAALDGYVPTLILQPLAENAVRHGIEPRLAPGTLTLRARREGDTLRLAVADDGVGLDPTATAARRGIGLANSEERLRTLHDDRARLEVVSPPEGGVRVEITLPFRTEPMTAATEGRVNGSRGEETPVA